MFKIIKDNKIMGVSENEPVLLDNYEVQEDTEHSISDYMQVNSEYVLTSSAEAIEQRKEEVRAVRNQYLKQYVDDRAKSPFMWNEVPEEEKALIGEYRKYLMDYPEAEGWFEQNPLTFEEWKQASSTAPEVIEETTIEKGGE